MYNSTGYVIKQLVHAFSCALSSYGALESIVKQLCNRKVRDFAMALRARNVAGTFEKRASVPKNANHFDNVALQGSTVSSD